MKSVKIACAQMTSGREMSVNFYTATKLAEMAKEQGAQWITFPENVCSMVDQPNIAERAFQESIHPAVNFFCELAMNLKCWLGIGSLPIHDHQNHNIYNRCFIISDKGEIVARYDKIHLFDVALPNGEKYHESFSFTAGDHLVVAEMPWGKCGLSICYDVRFPVMYQTFAKSGADFIFIPASFTRPTGQAHWEVLIRARAIETGCFVIAPAQTGHHACGRETHGHSLIVDPWGTILADAGNKPGIIVTECDLELCKKARHILPTQSHLAPFEKQISPAMQFACKTNA